MDYYLKDPGASIDYSFDWNAGYLSGQTVATSAWSVVPGEADGVRVVSASSTLRQTGALVAGGVAGRVYRLTNLVTLSDGRVDERTLVLRVEGR